MANNSLYDSPNQFVPATPTLQRLQYRSPVAEVPEADDVLQQMSAITDRFIDASVDLEGFSPLQVQSSGISSLQHATRRRPYRTEWNSGARFACSQDFILGIQSTHGMQSGPEQIVPTASPITQSVRQASSLTSLCDESPAEVTGRWNQGTQPSNCQSRASKQWYRTRLLRRASFPALRRCASLLPPNEQQLCLFNGCQDDIFM